MTILPISTFILTVGEDGSCEERSVATMGTGTPETADFLQSYNHIVGDDCPVLDREVTNDKSLLLTKYYGG